MPVSRADLQSAVDAALADGIKHAFTILVDGLIDAKSPDAEQNPVGRFKTCVRRNLEAHAQASTVISELFPENHP